MDDLTTEERDAWWQAFNQSVEDWRLWEQYWAIEGQINGIEPKRRYEFKHYLEFEHIRALAREQLTDGETETSIDRAIKERRGHNQAFVQRLQEVWRNVATEMEAFNQEQQRRWGRRIQIGIFAALGLVIFFGLMRAYWQ